MNIYGDDRYVLGALNHYDRGDGDRVTVRALAFTDRGQDGKVPRSACTQDLAPCTEPRER